MQNEEPKFKLVEYTPEEAKACIDEINAVLEKHNGKFLVTPFINQNGTIGAKAEILKQVPNTVEGAVPSPFMESNGETPTQPEVA